MRSLLDRVVAVLGRTSRGWLLAAVTTAFVGAAYLIGYAPNVPFSVERIKSIAGHQQILDLMFAYSPREGLKTLAALGPNGRQHYNYFQIADVLFPATYALALASWILALFRRQKLAVALAFVPLVTAIFDYLENLGVFVALRTYPDSWPVSLWTASAFGALKRIGIYVAIALIIAGAIGWLLVLSRVAYRRYR